MNMESLIYEIILGQVISKSNNYQAVPDGKGGRRIIKNDRIRAYEASFAQQCRIYRNKRINGPFTLFAKGLKTVLDCLQMVGAITDDKFCMKIVAEKFIDKINPRVTFAIQPQQSCLEFI